VAGRRLPPEAAVVEFDRSVKLGDVLTSVSILVACLTLVLTWLQERRLRRKEYADRIRRAAAETAVALERWKELALRFYEEIQPLITDADVRLLQEQDVVKVRDFLWRGLVAARAETCQQIHKEKIETAYVGLYGYHPDVQATYRAAVESLRRAEQRTYDEILEHTQDDVLALARVETPYQ